MVKICFSLIIVIIFAILSAWGLLHPGLHPTHDGEYHVIRFYEFDKVLREGVLYPRWAPDLNNGYGVPLFNFVYPLPNYMASIFHFLGASFIDAFKLSMLIAAIIGGIFFYLWAKIFWGNRGGIVSSIYYSFSPYHFVDVYIRGSIGEVWALAFFPGFLWSVTRLLQTNKKKFIIPAGIFYALIIFSHNILAVMFAVFSVSYIIFLISQQGLKRHLLYNLFIVYFIGLGLSAIFWLPALAEKHYAVGLQIYSFANRFPDLYQLIFPSWGSGFLPDDLSNQMSYQIGVANLLVVFISLIISFIWLKKKNALAGQLFFFLAWFILVFYLMLSLSLPIWNIIPLMSYFQFPWRFLSIEILIASFLAGSLLVLWRSNIVALLMILLAYFLGVDYTKPAYYHDRTDSYYISRSNFIDGTNSPGNVFNTIWVDAGLQKQKSKVSRSSAVNEVKIREIKINSYTFDIKTLDKSNITINTAYFPGWKAFVDNREVVVSPDKHGLISFLVPKGVYSIYVVFADTMIRTIATLISFITALFLFGSMLKSIIFKI